MATLNPTGYQRNLKLLDDIVALCATNFQLKRFQREDYARGALHDGIILGHDTGLGKTIALFLWPLLKTGCQRPEAGDQTSGLRPLASVLLVVPGDGHDQTDDESKKHFQTKAIRLDSQETFYRLSKLNPRTGRRALPPNYYLTSYTQLSGNGVVPFPELDSAHPERTLAALNLKEADVINWFSKRAEIFRVEYGYLEATPDTTWKEIEARWTEKRKGNNEAYVKLTPQVCNIHRAWKLLAPIILRRRKDDCGEEIVPIMLAGVECMAELHSFHLCNNVILSAYSWAWDKFEQAINRAHRLNSPWPVDVWSVICEGSIDRKLDASLHEKGDATGLVLDGHLLGENPAEVNLAELLHSAHVEFDQIKTMDELELEKDWPRLRAALGRAFLAWSRTASIVSSPSKGLVAPKRCAEADLPLWRQRFFRQ